MKKIFLIILIFNLMSCGQRQTFDQNIWFETNSMTIFNSTKEKPYSGRLTGKVKGKKFFGKVLNGKPDGICYWLNKNSDTIQLLKFQNGERVFSKQFYQNTYGSGKE